MLDGEYTYEVISTEDDARVCARLIAEEFTAHNPITCFDQITPARFFDQCSWSLMREMLPEQLSFLARHHATGEIVAATIAGDLYRQQQRKQQAEPSQVIAVDGLLDEMDELFISRDFGEELQPNMVLHAPLMAVRSSHAGKGILKQMVQGVCDHARRHAGFQYLLVQVTHQATRHIFLKKFGGREMTIVDPRTWVWQPKGKEPTYPYKDYQGGVIPNILVKL